MMNREEVIRILGDTTLCTPLGQAAFAAIKDIKKLKAYEDTGLTPEEIEEELERQKPKKPQEVLLAYGKGYECKNCGNELSVTAFNGVYCHWCGQKLDWQN